MGDDLVIMVDYDNICRLCLDSTGAMSDIFATYGKISMQDQILCITGLATTEDDGLPSKICHRCRHIVELSCELRDVVDKSTKLLAKLAHGSSDKCSENNDNYIESTNHISNKGCEEKDSDAETIVIERYDRQSNNKLLYDSQDVSDTIEEEYEQDETIANDIDDEYYERETLESYDSREIMVDINENTAFGDTDEYRDAAESAPVRKKTKRPPPELVCQLCLCEFATEEEVKAHVDTHYEGTSQLENYLNMKKHPLMCTMCDVELSKPQLVKHHRKHLRINPYKCKHPGCNYEGTSSDALRHHATKHGAATRVCEMCGAQFRRPSALQQHVRRAHAAPGEHVCAACGLRARNEPALRVHVRAHHAPPRPRLACAEVACGRTFASARALDEHARAHRGERRYRCELCHVAAYTSAAMLKRHMKLHERVRVRKCDKCPATFGEYGAYYRHRVAHHGPFLPHRCRACSQGYQSESQLQIHEQKCERAKRLREYEQAQARQTDGRADGETEVREHMETDLHEELETDLQEDVEDVGADQAAAENVIELKIDDSDCLAQENVLYIEMEREDSEGEEHLDADN